MTSVFLTRRALLSGGAFVGLGALLAACGQQANNEGAATASAAPSETASASAVACCDSWIFGQFQSPGWRVSQS